MTRIFNHVHHADGTVTSEEVVKATHASWRMTPFEEYSDATIDELIADGSASKEVKAAIADRLEEINNQGASPMTAAEVLQQRQLAREARAALTAKSTKKAKKSKKVKKGTAGIGGEAEDVLEQIGSLSVEAEKQLREAHAILKSPTASSAEKKIATYTAEQILGSHNNGLIDTTEITVPQQGSTGSIKKARKVLADLNSSPQEKEDAGHVITYANLVKSHTPPESASKGIQHLLTKDPEHIQRLRELIKTPGLDPALKMNAGEVITQHNLEKSRLAEDSSRDPSGNRRDPRRPQALRLVARSLCSRLARGWASHHKRERDSWLSDRKCEVQAEHRTLTRPSLLARRTFYCPRRSASRHTRSLSKRRSLNFEMELAECEYPIIKQRLGDEITYLRLRQAHERGLI